MNVQSRAGKEPAYPLVANHIVDDPTPKDQAIYGPSVTPGFAIDVYNENWRRALPRGISPADLNFLDPANKLFRISHVMSSAGQALDQTKPCIITTRDRASTLMIGDSGGYQIASGRRSIDGDHDRFRILRWLEENADVAMTLDVPTGPVRKPGYKFKNTKDCLTATLEHLEFFHKHREPGKVRFLNVLQGNTTPESDAWYDAVKGFEFEGWAFAGILRHNFYNLCRRLLIMAHEGQLANKSWIHVLGTNELETAVMLTALQRAINRHINPDIRISFDTSSPFRILSWNKTYTVPRFGADRIVMESDDIPDGPELVGSGVRWPWPSPLGDRMTLGDIVFKEENDGKSHRDTQSSHLLAHHNLAALCYAVSVANRVYDSESIQHRHTIALAAGDAVSAIEKVFSSGLMTTLEKTQATFRRLRHGTEPKADDEERALLD